MLSPRYRCIVYSHASFFANCSSKFSRTVSAMTTLPVLRKGVNLAQGVDGVIEGDEETFAAVGAHHDPTRTRRCPGGQRALSD